MPAILFAAPFFTENARRFLRTIAAVPGFSLGLVSQDPLEKLPPEERSLVSAHERVGDGLSVDQLTQAALNLARSLGPIHRYLGVIEQIQVPLAEARERLGVPGMSSESARNFRDKSRMKERLREAGLAVARHRLAANEREARAFIEEVGLPVVIKPNAGAASQATFRVDSADALLGALSASGLAEGRGALVEEFVTGQEGSFDAFSLDGRVVWGSISRYHPTPLEVMQNPWMQWVVVLPRELDSPAFDDIRDAGGRALSALGLGTGMCHLEWFRRKDGSVLVSEVAARPPGAQLPTLMSRAHEVDCNAIWANLMINDAIEPAPPRLYAAGAAYLRGQGRGRVRAVHGLDVIHREVGHLVTDAKVPHAGQEPSPTYEGEGYILVRHPETRIVEDALRLIISTARVELG